MKNRVFIALNISPETKEKINNIASLIKPIRARASWVNPHNMHITLAFLGKIKSENLNKIITGLKYIEFKTFSFPLNTISGFPDIHKARALWIGADSPSLQINEYYKHVVQAINNAKTTFDEKEKFIPHITIARSKERQHKSDIEKIQNASEKALPFDCEITSLSVYESILSSQGAKYIELFKVE